MERSESVRKVEIREQITDLFEDFEETLKQEFQETAFTIMEEVENHYREISLNADAIPELMSQIKQLLKEFPKKLLVHNEGLIGSNSPTNRLKFKQFIDTDHNSVEWAIIAIEKYGIFVTGDIEGVIAVWDAKKLEVIKQHSLNYPIRAFAFDAAHERLIVASDSSNSKTPLQSFKVSKDGLDFTSGLVFESEEPILTLIVLEEERKLVTENTSWRIQVWDLDNYKYVVDIKVEGDQWFTRGDGIIYIPQSKLIAVPGADKQIAPIIGKRRVQDTGTSSLRMFSLENGELIKEKVINFKTVDKMITIEDKLVLVDNHGSLIYVNTKTWEEEARIDFEDTQIFDAIYCKKRDLLICTTESPVVIMVKFSEAKVLRKLHPRAIRCEKSLLYLEDEDKLLVPFQVEESDNINLGVLELANIFDFGF